jgi:hypothetical protein
MGYFFVAIYHLSNCSNILPKQIMDADFERSLYIIVSLSLFFLERDIIVDAMFSIISLCLQ